MTNDLKNFLEEEKKHFETYYCLSTIIVDIESEEEIKKWQENHDTRLINFVLDLVEKEVKEYKNRIGMPSGFGEDAVRADESRNTLNHVSTIINNLRV